MSFASSQHVKTEGISLVHCSRYIYDPRRIRGSRHGFQGHWEKMLKVNFNVSFTLMVPPATEGGLMEYSVIFNENSPLARTLLLSKVSCELMSMLWVTPCSVRSPQILA